MSLIEQLKLVLISFLGIESSFDFPTTHTHTKGSGDLIRRSPNSEWCNSELLTIYDNVFSFEEKKEQCGRELCYCKFASKKSYHCLKMI